MGIIDSLFERRTLSPTDDGYYIDAMPSLLASLIPSSSGIIVTEEKALTFTAYWACVKVISETMAMIPLHLYKRLTPRGKQRAKDHYLYPQLHDQANPEMTAFTFRQLMMVHLLTWGNFYANIERDYSKQVSALWPLNPRRMRMKRDEGRVVYIYQLPSGEKRTLDADQVFHVKGLSTNGFEGLSPVGQNREALGLGMAHTKFSNAFYKNGTNVGTVITYPGRLKDPGRKNIRKSIEKYHAGLDHSHRLLILDEDMKIEKIGMKLKDAQHLEATRYNLEDMCRIHRLQLHKAGDYTHANFSNVEQMNIEFHTDTCLPWSINIEQEVYRQLLTEQDKQLYFAEHLMDVILRGDIKNRYEAYDLGIGNGFLSKNDVRDKENMNPMLKPDGKLDPAGDEYWHQNIWTKVGEGAPAPIINKEKQSERAAQVQIVVRDDRSNKESVPVEVVTENRKASPAARNKARKVFTPLFKDFGDKIVHIEVTDIRRAIDKYLPKRNADGFIKWLDKFYDKFPEKISKHMLPLIQSYGSTIIDAANKEINGSDLDADKVKEFNEGYIELFTKRYISSSRGQLVFVADKKRQASIEDDLHERLDEWEEKRSDKIAKRETVEASDAFAKLAFVAGGVTRLIWVAQGVKPCPYCEALNGTVMGIEHNFVDQGVAFEPEGADGSMKIYSPCSHAPLHGGCVCTIIPE